MADPWRSSSRRSSTPWRSSSAPWRQRVTPASKPKKGGGGVFGFVGNLAGDVEDMVVGLGPSLARTGMALGHDVAKVSGYLPGASGYAKRARRQGFKSDDLAREVGSSYAHTYGPLVKGDVGEFAHRFYEHPLGPILDAASLLSLGTASAVKVGALTPGAAGMRVARSPGLVKRGAIELHTPGGKVRKPLARQALRAEVQTLSSGLLNKLPAETRVLGEHARAARIAKKPAHRQARGQELLEVPFLKAVGKVRGDRSIATFWLSQVPLPEDRARLAALLAREGSDTAQAQAAILTKPKIADLHLNPDEKMLAALREASGVAEAQRAVLGISEDVARRRALMPTLMARGATLKREIVEEPLDLDVLGDIVAGKPQRVMKPPPREPSTMTIRDRPRTFAEAEARLAELDAETDRILKNLVTMEMQMRPTMWGSSGKAAPRRKPMEFKEYARGALAEFDESVDLNRVVRKETKRSKVERYVLDTIRKAADKGDPTAKRFQDMIDESTQLKQAIESHSMPAFMRDPDHVELDLGTMPERILEPGPGYNSIEEMIEAVEAELAASGRPLPVYMPHTSEIPTFKEVYGVGGKGIPNKAGPMKETMGILLGRGQVIADPRVLSSSFRQSIKYALFNDIHRLHLEHAVPLPDDMPIPKGYSLVRQKRSERTPYTIQKGSEFREFAEEALDADAEFKFADNPFTTKDGQMALFDPETGTRLIVSDEFSRQLTGEFVKASGFARYMQKYPVRVWRHLVLKLRPAWLVNNIIGNTLLYAIHSADPLALQEFAATFKRLAPRKQADAIDELMRTHFPEHVHGTFLGSQLPVARLGTKAERFEKLTSYLGVGLAQVDKVWEQGLRSAIVRAELKRSPELRTFAREMKGQTDEFWKLASKKLDENPELLERVSTRVNDALGDFLALGRFERDIVRSVFPFYAWFRVITTIGLKMPLTHPYKTALLYRLAQAGVQSSLEELGLSDQDVINYAKGFVALGEENEEGRVPGFATTSLNPFATIGELEDFVLALASGKPGEAWSKIPGANPFYAMPIEYGTGARSRSGAPTPESFQRFGLLGGALFKIGSGFPQYRLGTVLAGRQYKGTKENPTLIEHDRLSEILRYLGIPYADISPTRAGEIERIGR